MQESRFVKFGFDLRVVAAILAASLAVGIVNNLRVGDERRVPWSGAGIEPADDLDTEGESVEQPAKKNGEAEKDDDGEEDGE